MLCTLYCTLLTVSFLSNSHSAACCYTNSYCKICFIILDIGWVQFWTVDTHIIIKYKISSMSLSQPWEFIMLYNVNQKIFENIDTGSDQTDYLMKQVTMSRVAFSAVYSFSFGWKWNSYWLQNYPTWAWVDTRLLWVERRVDDHLWKRIIIDDITMADSSTPVSVCDK